MSNEKCELFKPSLLKEIRNQFEHVESDPISGKRVFLENAGGTLTLKKVVKVTAFHTALPDNAGRNNSTSSEIGKVIKSGIEDLRIFLGVKSGIVALGESTTANVFRTLTPVVMNVPGTNIVTTDLYHPAVYDATRVLAERLNKEWRCASLSPDKGIVEPESILECIDSDTIILALIHSSNNLGTRNDVKTIIKEARKIKPDLFVLVDGAQNSSHSLIDVEDLGCDIYTVSSYKTYSKIGASAFYLSERASKLSHDKLIGHDNSCWELGTREQAGYAAWSEVIKYLCWLGSCFSDSENRRELIIKAMEKIRLYELAIISQMLYGNADTPGMLSIKNVEVMGETKNLKIKDPVFLFSIKGKSSAEVVSAFERENIRVNHRTSDAFSKHTLHALGIEEAVRVSACHYTSSFEIDFFLRILKRIAE